MKNNIFIFICIFCCFHTNKCLCQNEIVDAYFSTNLMELRNLVNNSSSNVKILNRKYLEFLATLNLLSDGEICNYNPHIPPIVNIYELNIIEKWYLKNRKVITYEIVDKIKKYILIPDPFNDIPSLSNLYPGHPDTIQLSEHEKNMYIFAYKYMLNHTNCADSTLVSELVKEEQPKYVYYYFEESLKSIGMWNESMCFNEKPILEGTIILNKKQYEEENKFIDFYAFLPFHKPIYPKYALTFSTIVFKNCIFACKWDITKWKSNGSIWYFFNFDSDGGVKSITIHPVMANL